ncbi:hypothetical protein [Herminiimonas sp. CN]|uniref:hypothetical protein n=1 Tax=Herminiimonas sp. CN TaxID=1349818 RepID=UPI000473AD61|nr:hypothetical protein [Herminiimonas sp. CN]
MKSPKFLLLTIALALPLSALAAESAKHEHDAATQVQLELNAGKKWSTDAPLRQAMTHIRKAVATALPAAHGGKLTPAQYDAFGNEVTAQITYIVENCKLDPQADAQLHVVVGGIMSGIDVASGKQHDQERALGVVAIAQSLNSYGKYFDHANWKSIKLPH